MKTYKNKSKKNTRKNTKKYKNIKKGGWKNTNANFIEYRIFTNDKIPTLGHFESKLELDLFENIIAKYPEIESFGDMRSKIELYKKKKDTKITYFELLTSIVPFIRNLPIEKLQDDLDYTFPKFTIIPAGTIFYRRHKTDSFVHGHTKSESHTSNIWLDYSGTFSSKHLSFLKNTNASLTKEYVNLAKTEFGPYLMKFQVNKNLLIFHYPSYVTSVHESWARYFCYQQFGFCGEGIDGYTLDFLKFNPNKGYRNLPILEGFRELCIYDNKNIDFLETKYDP